MRLCRQNKIVPCFAAGLTIVVLSGLSHALRADSIFVDGMSSDSTFWGIVAQGPIKKLDELKGGLDIRDYLLKSKLGGRVKNADPSVFSVPFGGQIVGDSPDVNRAVETLKLKIKVNLAEQKPTTIYAHSFGTVIAHRALIELQSDSISAKAGIKLITLNSPLGKNPNSTQSTELKDKFNKKGWVELANEAGKVPRPSNVSYWVNLWAARDPISGIINIADENIQFDREIPPDLVQLLEKRINSQIAGPLAGSLVVGPMEAVFYWHSVSYGPARLAGQEFDLKIPESYWNKIMPLGTASGGTTSGAVSIDNEFYRQEKNPFAPAYIGQCTWFVRGRMLQEGIRVSDQLFRRDAPFWLEDAQKAGFFTGTQPAKHAVAFWKSIGGSEWGHVAFVEDDSGKVTESNIGPDKTSMIVVMRDNDDVYYEDKITRQRLKLQLGSPLPQSVRIPSASVWKLEEYATDSKTGKIEWGRVNAVEFANWLQNSGSKLTLPKDKQRIWFKRDWHGVEGNFTGIRLAAGEPGYSKPDKYIYLSEHCSVGTGATLIKLRNAPGLNQPVAGTVSEGARMQVVEAPIRAGELVWWKLSCQTISGWAPTHSKPDTIFEAAQYEMVEVTSKFLWFHGSLKAHGTFYVATRDNKLMELASLASRKIRDLPVGTENTVIGGPSGADRRVWWNLTVGPDTGWAIIDRWGFTYPKD